MIDKLSGRPRSVCSTAQTPNPEFTAFCAGPANLVATANPLRGCEPNPRKAVPPVRGSRVVVPSTQAFRPGLVCVAPSGLLESSTRSVTVFPKGLARLDVTKPA
jgi:hypothetical protein